MRLAILLLGCLSLASTTASGENTSEREVRYLLKFVAESGCQLLRNGTEHTPHEAAEHLAMKYERGRRYVDSAEDFIDRLATESSWSGKPYRVDCADGSRNSGEWLHSALATYRQGQAPE